MTLPSRTRTAPTSGLGLVSATPQAASSSARFMKTASAVMVGAVLEDADAFILSEASKLAVDSGSTDFSLWILSRCKYAQINPHRLKSVLPVQSKREETNVSASKGTRSSMDS